MPPELKYMSKCCFLFSDCQHVLLAVKIAVAYFIPDVPKWVDVELSRIAYQSKLALQKEVGHGGFSRLSLFKMEI